jgi:hypothetical protein
MAMPERQALEQAIGGDAEVEFDVGRDEGLELEYARYTRGVALV